LAPLDLQISYLHSTHHIVGAFVPWTFFFLALLSLHEFLLLMVHHNISSVCFSSVFIFHTRLGPPSFDDISILSIGTIGSIIRHTFSIIVIFLDILIIVSHLFNTTCGAYSDHWAMYAQPDLASVCPRWIIRAAIPLQRSTVDFTPNQCSISSFHSI
jgi:hypothetical protein